MTTDGQRTKNDVIDNILERERRREREKSTYMPDSSGMVGGWQFGGGAVGRGGGRCARVGGRLQHDEAAVVDRHLAVAGHVRRPAHEERVQRVHPAQCSADRHAHR